MTDQPCARCGHLPGHHLAAHGLGRGCGGLYVRVVDGLPVELPCSCAGHVAAWSPRTLAVSGGRGFADRGRVRDDLAALAALGEAGPNELAHGGARGLDEIAAEVAAELGLYVLPPWLPSWATHGRAAGHERNAEG